MSGSLDHFRRNIFWSPAKAIWVFQATRVGNLGDSEIGEFDITVCVEENVFRFEISVYDIAIVEVAEGKRDLSSIKFGFILAKVSDLRKMLK